MGNSNMISSVETDIVTQVSMLQPRTTNYLVGKRLVTYIDKH